MADNNRNWEDRPGGYSQDWNQDRELFNRNYDQDRNYENRNYNQGRQGDMRNVSYGSVYGGNVEQRERETNMARGRGYDRRYGMREQRFSGGQYDQDYNQGGYARTGYGASGGYGNANRNYDRDYDNRYGGDSRNFGNANQSGYDRDWWDRAKDKVSSWFGGDQDSDRGTGTSRSMDYRGKGPKGYTRSDARIQEDVCDRLYDDSYVDASDIEVKVEGSEVVLSGSVHSREEKRRAEDLAEGISGVRNVQNQLRVQRGSEDSSSSSYRSSDSSRDRW